MKIFLNSLAVLAVLFLVACGESEVELADTQESHAEQEAPEQVSSDPSTAETPSATAVSPESSTAKPELAQPDAPDADGTQRQGRTESGLRVGRWEETRADGSQRMVAEYTEGRLRRAHISAPDNQRQLHFLRSQTSQGRTRILLELRDRNGQVLASVANDGKPPKGDTEALFAAMQTWPSDDARMAMLHATVETGPWPAAQAVFFWWQQQQERAQAQGQDLR